MGGSRERARDRILSISQQGGSSVKKAVYDEARYTWSNITVDEDTFYTNLENGDYDNKVNFLHSSIMKDVNNRDLETYQNIATDMGARPIDIVAKEGKDGLEKGKAFYADSIKIIVGKVKGGDKLIEGYEKAEETINKLDEIEKNGLTTTPLEYYKNELQDNIKQRAYDFFKDKTGIEITEDIEDFSYDASTKVRGYFKGETSKRTPTIEIKTEALDEWGWGGVDILLDGFDSAISDLLIEWKDDDGNSKYFVKPLEGNVDIVDIVLPDEVNDAIGKIIDSIDEFIVELEKIDVVAEGEIEIRPIALSSSSSYSSNSSYSSISSSNSSLSSSNSSSSSQSEASSSSASLSSSESSSTSNSSESSSAISNSSESSSSTSDGSSSDSSSSSEYIIMDCPLVSENYEDIYNLDNGGTLECRYGLSEGRLAMAISYLNGERHGYLKSYSISNNHHYLLMEEPWVYGELHGIKKQWFADGYISRITPVVHGTYEGTEVVYYSTLPHNIQQEYVRINGVIQSKTSYYENEQVSYIQTYVNSNLDSWKNFNESGIMTQCVINCSIKCESCMP